MFSREKPRLLGVELYFDDLEAAKHFYHDTLGLELQDEEPGHHAQFDGQSGFICLERKGVESYPSRDKAVVFLEVSDLRATVESVGRSRILQMEPATGSRPSWAVLHDPEGHNVLLIERKH